jgi:hypothetical protein
MGFMSSLKSVFTPPRPAGPQVSVKRFTTADATVTKSGVTIEGDAWRLEASNTTTFRLFEVADPGLEQCQLAYRARIRSEDVGKRAYLEMWCRFPGRGEFFSRGFHNAVMGTMDFASVEIPFYLKAGQRPDLIRVNVVIEGAGKIWIRDLEILQTSLN